jgi:FKBP-type peptidyl-prolyl cis-trans isomerase
MSEKNPPATLKAEVPVRPAKPEKPTGRETLLSRIGMGLLCSAIVTVTMNLLHIKTFIIWICAAIATLGGWQLKPPDDLRERVKSALSRIEEEIPLPVEKPKAVEKVKAVVEEAKEKVEATQAKVEAVVAKVDQVKETVNDVKAKVESIKERVEAAAASPLARMVANAGRTALQKVAAKAEAAAAKKLAERDSTREAELRRRAQRAYLKRKNEIELAYIGWIVEMGTQQARQRYDREQSEARERFRRLTGM